MFEPVALASDRAPRLRNKVSHSESEDMSSSSHGVCSSENMYSRCHKYLVISGRCQSVWTVFVDKTRLVGIAKVFQLGHLAENIGVSRTQTTIDSPGLAVDIASFIAAEK